MKAEHSRRDFISKSAIGMAALAVPITACAGSSPAPVQVVSPESKLIVPKENGIRITGTFLDEISHDIPHQNWG
jgi:hypothetical protein